MTNVGSPSGVSPITPGQIGKIQELLAARLRKSGLPRDPTQQVIETQGDAIADEMLAAVRRRVEAVSDLIVRRAKVNRTRAPQAALDATGRKQYTDPTVVNAMPRGEGDEVEVYFFNVGRYVSDDEVEKEFDLREFKPADPYALAAVNEADPAFADEYPNATHWKDADGKWRYAAFSRWLDGRFVSVLRGGGGWGDAWWFAGVRK